MIGFGVDVSSSLLTIACFYFNYNVVDELIQSLRYNL